LSVNWIEQEELSRHKALTLVTKKRYRHLATHRGLYRLHEPSTYSTIVTPSIFNL